QGSAHRRGCRRGARRLRHIQGGKNPPVLGEDAAIALAPAAAEAPVSVSGYHASAGAELFAGLLRHRSRSAGPAVLLAPAALGYLRQGQAVLLQRVDADFV